MRPCRIHTFDKGKRICVQCGLRPKSPCACEECRLPIMREPYPWQATTLVQWRAILRLERAGYVHTGFAGRCATFVWPNARRGRP